MKTLIVHSWTAVVLLAIGLALVPSTASGQGRSAYVTNSYDYYIRVIDLPTQAASSSIYTGAYSGRGALSRNGSTLWVLAGGQYYTVRTPGGPVLYSSPYYSYSFSRPAFSPDGSNAYFLRGGYGPSGSIVNLLSYDTLGYARIDSFTISGVYSWSTDPVISKDGNKIYFSDGSQRLLEIDPFSGAILRTYSSSSYIYKISMSPDGSKLCVVHYSTIEIVDLSTFTVSRTFTPSYSVSTVVMSKDGSTLYVIYSGTNALSIINMSSGTSSFYSLNYTGVDAALDPSDSLLYVVHNVYSSNVSIFNLNTKTTTKTLTAGAYPTGIAMPGPIDTIPPAAVSNLQAVPLAYNTARLVFTAPGSDGTTGTASFYLVRYDTIPITEGNFAQAMKFLRPPAPKPAGSVDTIDVAGLKGNRQYYLAVKAGDGVLNLSPLNTVSVDLPPPPHIVLQPDSLSMSLSDNDSATASITISNTGGSGLDYRVELIDLRREEPGSLMRPALTSDRTGMATSMAITTARSEETGSHGVQADAPAAASHPGENSLTLRPAAAPLTAASTKVLVIYSDYVEAAYDVTSKLLATGQFGAVDLFDAQGGMPTLELLKGYDVVFLWTNIFLPQPTAMGDLLADYIDGGGRLVLGMFSMGLSSSNPNPRIQGRFDDGNYWVIQPSMFTSSTPATLGKVADPRHPIMRGVSTFDGGYYSFRPTSASLAPGSKLIASWSDNAPLVAVRTIHGTTRVDLGFYPPSSDYESGLWLPSSDGAKIMANALSFAAAGGGEGLQISFVPDSGRVAAGGAQNVLAIMKTTDAQAGRYHATIGITSNDPDGATRVVPVGLVIRDLTPPHLAIRFFQNEAFPEYLNVICLARESLYTSSIALVMGTDTTHPALKTIDTTNFVYACDFKFRADGILTVLWDADDSVGNHGTTTRQLAVQGIGAHSGGRVASIDLNAELTLPPDALERSVYVTAELATESTGIESGTPASSTYRFAPAQMSLNRSCQLRIRYEERPGLQDGHLGIYEHAPDGRWTYLVTKVDARTRTAYADVRRLGEFRLIENPSVESLPAEELPDRFELSQNYPNPFNPSTTIRYGIPGGTIVELRIFDILGREVRTLVHEYQGAGYHETVWDGTTSRGTEAASGVYYFRLTAGSFSDTRTMLLMR